VPASWLRPDPVPADATAARVVEVIDGDTIRLEDGSTVRVLGLDAPETRHPDLRGPQPFGVEAAERLRELVQGRTVRLERDISDRDHYGRLLRHVWIDRSLVAEVLVREGLAHPMSIPPDRKHVHRLRAAEEEARDASIGLWSVPRPTSLPLFRSPP
jgi:micrococcal nuclease